MWNMMDSKKNQNFFFQPILQAKQLGELYGQLGDLGVIDGKRTSPSVLRFKIWGLALLYNVDKISQAIIMEYIF